MQPLAFDICAGLGGWTDGFLAEGWNVIGIDIERRPYPAQLWLQDIRTIHGSQLRNADAIVASPPCQAYSWMAMPWSLGKAKAAAIRADDEFSQRVLGRRGQLFTELNALFDACFRIQREASEAAGRHIPMVVENVKGAQPWVGKARANFGSFYLWGDVDSIGGRIVRRGDIRWGAPSVKAATRSMKMGRAPVAPNGVTRQLTNPEEWQNEDTHKYGRKVPGMNFHDFEKTGEPGRSFQSAAVAHNTESGLGNNPVNCPKPDGIKNARNWWSDGAGNLSATTSSHSPKRKQASAKIAMIPPDLARHIARIFKPGADGTRHGYRISDVG